ncbi:MAG TPA: gas vesicle protein GvpJ [Chloroflexota bacterium]|nr:gas vesicle protein GvpJ [Chloroflexota bacterium]
MTPYASNSATLVDVLDRVLDKGLVVAGDIKISLANVELLTIRIRLLVCSVDKAEEIGLDWWRYDQSFVRAPQAAVPAGDGTALPGELAATERATIARLEARIAELERELGRRPPVPQRDPGSPGTHPSPSPASDSGGGPVTHSIPGGARGASDPGGGPGGRSKSTPRRRRVTRDDLE